MSTSSPNPTRVLVFSPYALWTFHTVYEGAIAKACRARGCEVNYLLCDGLPECDQHWFSKTGAARPADICQRCRAATLTNVGPKEFPSRWIGEFVSPAEREAVATWAAGLAPQEFRSAEYRGLQLGEWVISSINSYFREYPPDLESEMVVQVYRNFLVSAGIVALALINYLDQHPVDSAIQFNGRQSITRVAMEIFMARGIRVLTHERGEYHCSHLNARANAHCMSPVPFELFWKEWGGVALQRHALEKARMWLVERRYGANLAWIPFSKSINKGSIRQQLKLSESKLLFALFTSSTDETASDPLMQGPYESQDDWVQQVIDWIKDRDDAELVIKVHPNLAGNDYIGAATGELGFYQRIRPNLPPNVRMLMPKDNVSAYSLADEADIGLTFGSTVGLEMAMLGKPILLASKAYYEYADAILTLRSTPELFSLLDRCLQPFDHREIQREAFRIAYYAMCVCEMPFPKIRMETLDIAHENFKSDAELAPGLDASVDDVCRFLVDGGPLFESPSKADVARSTAEEDAFFEELAKSPQPFREKHLDRWLFLQSTGRAIKGVLEHMPFGAGEKLINLTRSRWRSILKSVEVGEN